MPLYSDLINIEGEYNYSANIQFDIENDRKLLRFIPNETTIDLLKEYFIDITKEYGSFSNYIWHFTNNKIIKNNSDIFPTHNELSDKISKDLSDRGMRFVGTVIIYSYLQAIGIINDHETTCYKY